MNASPFHEVLVIGGGLVGSSLAVALSRAGLDTALVEMAAPGALPAVFDQRNLSFAEATVNALTALDILPCLHQPGEAIRRIQITRQGDFGRIWLNAQDYARAEFGQVVVARDFGQALESALAACSHLTRYRPARFVGFGETHADWRELRLVGEAGEYSVRARLVVAADGTDSGVRAALGIGTDEHDYRQRLLIARTRAAQRPDGTAYERLTDHGPTALLPRGDGNWGLIHAVDEAHADALLALGDAAFLQRVQEVVGWRIGKLLEIGPRSAHPARRVLARRVFDQRVALVGNAAQTLHPIGAQGFNLGLRDALMLAELIAKADDPGDATLLHTWADKRHEDRQRTASFSDGLARLTANPSTSMRVLRSLGMTALDRLPFLQMQLVTGAMGYRGQVPELSRLKPLSHRERGWSEGAGTRAMLDYASAMHPHPPFGHLHSGPAQRAGRSVELRGSASQTARPPPKGEGKNKVLNHRHNLHDAIIIGAGIVGASCALALAQQGLDVVLIDTHPPPPWDANNPDLRVYAIAPDNAALLDALGIWSQVQRTRAQAYRRMQVWDAGGGEALRFDADALGRPELGWIVESSLLLERLWAALPQAGVELRCPATVGALQPTATHAELRLHDGRTLNTRLVIAADGAASSIRRLAGIEVSSHHYQQRGIVGYLNSEHPHQHTAWQRFLPTGPLALLPCPGNGHLLSMVWTLPDDEAARVLALNEDAFARELTLASEARLGTLRPTSKRAAFALKRQLAHTQHKERVLLIGDAAHAVHPLAGQGVNLGLRDVSALAADIAQARQQQRPWDSLARLSRWARTRRSDNTLAAYTFEAINRVFSNDALVPTLLRGQLLTAAHRVPGVSSALARHAAG